MTRSTTAEAVGDAHAAPMGFLFVKYLIIVIFVRGRSFCSWVGRVGMKKGYPHGHPFPLVENYLKPYELLFFRKYNY